MAKSDVLVRMRADTNNYDANIAKARRTLESFKEENLSLGGVLSQVSKSLTTYAAGFMGITALAGKLSDVTRESIELARSGEGVRQAFERLNRPDLLNSLREATHGTVTDIELMKSAVKFNDFNLNLDELGTMLAFAQQKAKDTGQSIDYMVDSIVTGLGRKSLMILDNLGLSATEIKDRMGDAGDMTKAVGEIIRDQMQNAGDYVETAADRAAKATVDAKNKMEEMGRAAMPAAEQWEKAWNAISLGALDLINEYVLPLASSLTDIEDRLKGIANWKINPKPGITNLADDPNIDDNGNYIKKNWNTGNMITYSPVSSIGDVVVSGTKKTKHTPRGGGKKDAFDISKIAFNPVSDPGMKYNPDDNWMSVHAMMTDEAKKKMLGLAEATRDWGDAMAKVKEAEIIDGINKNLQEQYEAVQKTRKAWTEAGQAIGVVGTVMNSIKNPAAQTAGAVAQAIANIALAYSQAIGEDGTIKSNIWYFIAATAAAMVSMATTINQIHSATGYAEGGIVSGTKYSGDNIPIMANAGEIVLTRAMAGNLASSLQNNGLQNLRLTATLKGEDIRLSVNNNGRRTGRGEMVQSNTRNR